MGMRSSFTVGVLCRSSARGNKRTTGRIYECNCQTYVTLVFYSSVSRVGGCCEEHHYKRAQNRNKYKDSSECSFRLFVLFSDSRESLLFPPTVRLECRTGEQFYCGWQTDCTQRIWMRSLCSNKNYKVRNCPKTKLEWSLENTTYILFYRIE